jgi:UDP-N-acetyl-2-amino-2-deoxyglucuronate dehydrogenase
MIKIGLVGCGRISKKHLEAISTIPEFKLTAVCDSDPKALQETLQTRQVQGFADYSEFLEKGDMDIVDICTPSGLHPFMGLEAAKKGYHVILEKPMGLNYNACLELVDYCEKHNRKLFVVKQNRYNPPVQILKNAIETGRLGKLITCNTTVRWRRTQEYYDQAKWRGTWELDGGVLMNQASHHVDLLRWLGGAVKSVYAKAKTVLHNIKVDDTATVMLEFENGCLGTIEATTCTSPVDFEGSVTFLGEKGLVRIGGFAVNKLEAWKFEDGKPNEEEEVKQHNYSPPNVYGFGHKRYLKNVADTLFGKEEPMTDGRDGLKTLKLLLAIYESVNQKKEIILSEFNPDA